ncbi:nucleocapsid protein [Wufeng Myotis altarium paramyxovirus 1]|uniref:Nucleocapsid n=1 Tax=Wufeng Myotis altarium paramyxovirus 1 TaxID=2928981 RepID=A0A8T9KLX0_9MONO|nr:nucleocapsid protein [Wufeng Myotis altarium paramyxovirus 1]
MSGIFEALRDLKDFKNGPIKTGLLHGSLNGIRKKVIIPVPANTTPAGRWAALKFLLALVWSGKASGAVSTGAFLSLLTFFAEQPSQMLKTLINDPDLEAHIVELTMGDDMAPKFASRGLDMSQQQTKYQEIAKAGPKQLSEPDPFARPDVWKSEIRTTEELQKVVNTVTMQIWILLTKAVTAPDTARESEQKRWIKFIQQRRVSDLYRLKNEWLNIARDKISADISIRRLMVAILIAINKSSGVKSRLLQAIADIGNYISETGMAGFFLTIKFGIETRYPVLALNEFQGDLTTMINLMKLYKEQGDNAPYLVILEESVQTKFAPGMYPILWSFAMGVGVALDKSMNNLNFNRPFLDPNYFRLGQETVHRMEGNVDTRMAESLGLTQDQIDNLRDLVKGDQSKSVTAAPKARVSEFSTYTGNEDIDDAAAEDKPQGMTPREMYDYTVPIVPRNTSMDMQKFRDMTAGLAETLKAGRAAVKQRFQNVKQEPSQTGPQASSSTSDMDVMNTV